MNAPEQPDSPESAIDELSRRFGVVGVYDDIWGNTIRAPDETRRHLLKALGALDDESDLKGALRADDARRWQHVAPKVAVFCVEDTPYRMRFHFRDEHRTATYRW